MPIGIGKKRRNENGGGEARWAEGEKKLAMLENGGGEGERNTDTERKTGTGV